MSRRLITTDCHYSLPYTLADELPESYREHLPHLETRDDGTYLVRPAASGAMRRRGSGAAGMMGGANAGAGVKVEDDGRGMARAGVGNVCPEGLPSYDPAEQLADLERDGVYGAVLISGGGAAASLPLEVSVAYCKVANDYVADTWRPYFDRVAPGISLPWSDVGAAVKELERAAGMGLRPALLPDGILGRPYHLPEWEPVWEAASSLKVPITMHVGGPRSPDDVSSLTHPGPSEPIIGFYTQSCAMGETLAWFVFSGIFERYPDLHVIVTEGYAGWLAFAMQMFDHHTTESRFGPWTSQWMAGQKELDAPPSYYMKRQAHATFMWDPVAVHNRAFTGLDSLMWGNDYPHHEGSFPYSQEWIDKMFAGVPEDEVDQIVRGNAARIFGLEV